MGPIPIEKLATKANNMIMHNTKAHVNVRSEWSITMSPDAKAASDIIIPVTLLKSNGRRQILSSKKVATKIDTVLTNPTATVASNFLLEEVIPAFSKILGLYKTTESIPEHCWKKWIPRHAIKTWRTAGVGWRSSSFQTSSPWLRFETLTMSSVQSSGIPAASLISANLIWASSFVSEVLSKTVFASPSRPCMTSQRGDSGIHKTAMPSITDGTAPTPSMIRHPKCTGSFENT